MTMKRLFALNIFCWTIQAICIFHTSAQGSDGGFLCEDGWVLHRDQCYWYSTYNRNWYAARQECQDLGADLAQVRVAEVNTFLFGMLNETISENYLMGLNDRVVEGFYAFNDETFQAEYTNWFPGEPSNSANEDAHCVSLGFATQRWFDENCDAFHPPICTKNPVGINCDPGWINYKNETCVFFAPGTENVSWEGSRWYCQDLNANLVAVRDALFQVFIAEIMPEPVNNTGYWISLNDRAENNFYVWRDERGKTGYLNWDTANLQPDNLNAAGSNCVTLYKNVSNPSSYGWLDVGCDNVLRFICQYDAVDINECDDDPCLNDGTCVNSHGFFYCECPTGFTGQTCQIETIYECEDDWLLKDSSCYLFEGASENWFGARVVCQGYGGDLAVIKDDETNTFLKARVRIINEPHNFGLNDLITEGYYVWLDELGEITYSNWVGGNPDNVEARGAQNCVSFNQTGFWLDRRCDRDVEDATAETGAFICRKAAVGGQCEDGWERYELDDACFYFAPGSLNWHAAREQCRNVGADLADIRDEFTNQFLTDNLPISSMYTSQFWIGLNDRLRSDSYVWLDETDVATYTNWMENQPDNLVTEAENCAGFNRVGDIWGWEDRRCDAVLSFICERPATTYCGTVSANLKRKNKKTLVESGSDAVEGNWPWQLAIQTKTAGVFTYQCGAALVSPQWAITSASCVNTTGPFRLIAGEHTLHDPTGDENYRVFTTANITMHPDVGANIALIHIDSLNIDSDYINTICLPPADYDFAGSSDCWITGWGTSGGENVLQQAAVDVLTKVECAEYWGGTAFDDTVVCSQDKNGVSDAEMCLPADTGSPLQCQIDGHFQLVGIAAFGDVCGSSAPSGFMKITHFLDWIETTAGIYH